MAKLSPEAARRIIQGTKYVENKARNRVERPTAPRIVPLDKLGITTSSITARSSKTPGSGTVQPYTYDQAADELVLTGDEVTVRNWTGTEVLDDVWIEYRIIDGVLWVVGNDCSGVAP